MIVAVELRGLPFFGDGLRRVEIPDVEFLRASTDEARCELAFKYGQNDFQPLRERSVSMGDVVRLGEKRFVCGLIGFQQLSCTCGFTGGFDTKCPLHGNLPGGAQSFPSS